MNILLHEWKRSIKSTLGWGAAMVSLIFLWIQEFTVYYENPEMIEILDTMPPAMLEMFGMYGANLTTVTGYVSVIALYIYIPLGIHAALLGSGILAKEEQDKTAEFLLTKPVKREKIVSMKAIVALDACFILNLATLLTLFFTTRAFTVEAGFYRFLLHIFLATFLVQLFFLGVGFFLAATKWYKRSGSVAVGLLLALYLVSVLSSLTESLQVLKYLTPFRYFEATLLLADKGLNSLYVFITLAVVAILLAGTYYLYRRRDLKI